MPTMVMKKFDPAKLRAWTAKENITPAELSAYIGKSSSYIGNVIKRREMPEAVFNLMCKLHGIFPAELTPDPKPVITDPPTPSKGESDIDCAVKMSVHGDRIRLTLMVNGQDDLVASAYIKGDGFLDLVKSFSYAAHMCYKLAEQRELNDR